ncbi:hypothetical protein D3C84_869160 [compost metagenome]
MLISLILSMESNFCDSNQRTGREVFAIAVATSPREVKVDSMTRPRTWAAPLFAAS